MRQRLFRLDVTVALLTLLSKVYAEQIAPTAVKKLAPNADEKLLAEHIGFAPVFQIGGLPDIDGTSNTTSRFHPAYNIHINADNAEVNAMRRAAEALALLQRRTSCPSGFGDCGNIGSPNKCCRDGTYCSYVPDSETGHIACCPDEANCGGAVGECPSGAVTCSPELGGGCCEAGFVCQGVGCVPSASATKVTETMTQVQSKTNQPGTKTETVTRTTVVEGQASTVRVTVIVTEGHSTRPTTITTTITQGSATGDAPYRPTGITSPDEATSTDSDNGSTQGGCPTGFYGCSATHGGGCCRTDRDCNTYSCPATPSTVMTNGATVVVPASDAAEATATSNCADGWFLCGKDAGPVDGCCPSGFSCGSVSCFTVQASQTEARQKELPTHNSKGSKQRFDPLAVTALLFMSCLCLIFAA